MIIWIKLLSIPLVRYLILVLCWNHLILFSSSIKIHQSTQTSSWEHYYLNQIDLTSSSPSSGVLINTTIMPLMSPSSPRCVYDNIKIKWKTAGQIHPTSVHVAFIIDNEWDGYSTPLTLSSFSNGSSVFVNPIQCEINEDHCRLNVRHAYVKDKKLFIEFDHPTNQVELLSTAKLNEAFSMNPSIISNAIGVWSNPSLLEMIITEEYYEAIVKSYREGTIAVSLRKYEPPSPPSSSSTETSSQLLPHVFSSSLIETPDQYSFFEDHSNSWQGQISLRPTRPGIYRIFMLNSQNKTLISKVHRVKVIICDELVTPDQYLHKSESNDEETLPPRSLLRYQGVISISGKDTGRGITIPNSLLPAKGSWSLSMWYYLIDSPTGLFRSLFYKGDGYDIHRTPSAWFLPISNRLALRATTETNPDIGSDSVFELPMKSWFHLTFVFDNSSTTGYQMTMYLNGNHDLTMTFPMKVLSNNYPLHLFKDTSHNGARGFAADVIIWDSALTSSQIKDIYRPISGQSPLIHSVSTALDFLSFLNQDSSSSTHENYSQDKEIPKDHIDEDYQEAYAELVTLQHQNQICSSQSNCQMKNWYDLLSSSRSIPSTTDYQHLLFNIDNALINCLPPLARLDLYAEGSIFGHVESLYKWSMLLGFGSEIPSNPCGIESFPPSHQQYHQVIYSDHENECLHLTNEIISDQIKAVVGLMIAAQLGYTAAYIPLSTFLSSSIGLGIFVLDFHSTESSCLLKKLVENIPLPSIPLRDSHKDRHEFIEITGGKYVDLRFLFEFSKFMRRNDARPASFTQNTDTFGIPISSSVFEMETVSPSFDSTNKYTNLATGLLFMAALDDHAEAFMMLGKRYEHQLGGLEKDIEVAAVYALLASNVASESYHKIGGQPILEGDRLTDATEKQVLVGNSGSDDEYIQTLTVQANEGHVDSMISLGEINYYGTRGVPRNQARALELYNRAAETGHLNGLCGAAGMYLKGEGTEKNVSRAVEMYHQAAKEGSIRALNGLGYIYFFGNGDEAPMNKTKAFHYFLTATEYGGDSDSWFNAGYCLEHGLGVEKDIERAAQFYYNAAKKFGYFDAIISLGRFHLQGTGVIRSAIDSLTYLNVANVVGPWVGWMRRGFNQYIQGQSDGNSLDYCRALMSYLHSGELGYEVSQGNSAFIIRRKLSFALIDKMIGLNIVQLVTQQQQHKQLTHLSEKLFVRQLLLSIRGGNSESAHLLGSYFLHHHPPPPLPSPSSSSSTPSSPQMGHEFPLAHLSKAYPTRLNSAYYWYSKSSTMGNAFGSLQCGLIHHLGLLNNPINEQRAEKYYQLAVTQYQNMKTSPSPPPPAATPPPGGGGGSGFLHSDQDLRFICEGLLWLIQNSKKYVMIKYLSGMIGWGLRWIFFEG